MTAICFYFQVHQPGRLRKYSYFDIGRYCHYQDDEVNREIFLKVANKCYLPATKLLLKLINKYPGIFKIAFSISGIFIEQSKLYAPQVLDAFKKLAATGQVEFLNETYYHSLSFLFSEREFKDQVIKHRELILKEFGYDATTFRNTELIYSDKLAKLIESLGYKTVLAEGSKRILGKRSPNHLYHPKDCKKIKLLLRNYHLTDDIAFRFSEISWHEYPISAEKYAHWLHSLHDQAEIINLFMDFETFGEHQWQESGIFEFLNMLPKCILSHPEYHFVTPAEASKELESAGPLSVDNHVSWADVDRDLSAWCGNNLQRDALQAIYGLGEDILSLDDADLITRWRSLLTSDHFYYMCTKYAADGDVHEYFSPYRNSYEAYINYQNIVGDLSLEIIKRKQQLMIHSNLDSIENNQLGIVYE